MSKESQRLKAQEQSHQVSSKSRFGLFSQPLSNAVGDDGEYKVKIHPRDESGKPVTQPRGIFTRPTRSGQLRKSNFGDINTLAALQDEFVDPGRKKLQLENESFRKGFNKEAHFRLGAVSPTITNSVFEYQQQNNPELDPKRNREEDGKVKSMPRNFYTNQQSTVIRSYFKPQSHVSDPYERERQMNAEWLKKNKALEGEVPFRPNSFKGKPLSTDRKVYASDVELKPKTARETRLNIYKHQNKWKDTNPGKKGHQKFFNSVVYVEDPPKQRQKLSLSKEREVFRSMSIPKSRVSPSVTMTHLKRSLNRSFSCRR